MLIIFDLDDTLYDRSGSLTDDLKGLAEIKPFPGVKELLQGTEHQKVLITKGKKELQEHKLDVLGIKDLFDQIIICDDCEDKRKAFGRFFGNKEVWAIGNRMDEELLFGQELGFKTVWLRHGKYKDLKAQFSPDYEIDAFSEFDQILRCKL